MDAIEAVCSGLPAEASRIRRRFWRDPEFLSVCEDYRDLLVALANLENTPSAEATRAEEYRQLAAELLAELAEKLEEQRSQRG